MNYKEILTLLAAGYTKAEISQMDDISPVSGTAGDDKTTPQASLLSPAVDPPGQKSSSETSQPIQPAEGSVPAPQSAGEEAAAPPDPPQQILQQLTELVRSVQASNRGLAEMGAEIIEPKQQALSTLRSLGGIPESQE